MSAAKYTTRPASAKASAQAPYTGACRASPHAGATATRSRTTNHTHTSIAMASTALSAESAQPAMVKRLSGTGELQQPHDGILRS